MAGLRSRSPRVSPYSRLAVALVAVAIGVIALVIARKDPAGSFSGGSVRDGIFELAAGWSLVLIALLFWARRSNGFGPLAAAAGAAWFLPEWSNPRIGVTLAFTIGLVFFVACPPLIAHAALAYPHGRVGSGVERAALAVAYVAAIALLGLLPTATFDPKAQGCLDCPANLALVHGDAGAYDAFNRWGLRVGLGWTIALVLVMGWRLARRTVPPVVAGPVLVPAAAYLGIVAWDFEHSLTRNVLSNDPFDVGLWRYEAVALVALAAGVAWGLYRAGRARSSVAQLVVELGRSRGPGGVRDALVQALGDPTLRLAYRRTESDEYVDLHGRRVMVEAGPGQAVTPLLREGVPVAALVHDPALGRDTALVDEVVAAARVAVENERFEAEVRAQLESLRASRARIVEAGDAEARRLERDLHDGAQQRLVGLSLVLRMLRTQLCAEAYPRLDARLEEAETELRAAVAELRELAHGIFPAVLADEGLAAAVETLAEGSPTAIVVEELPEERFDAAVEAAAYFVIAETVKRTRARRAMVAAAQVDGSLVVEVYSDGERDEALTDLEDRVGALDGTLAVRRGNGHVDVRAELPCG